MNNIDKNYQALLQDILNNGVDKQTRNGKTISVFGRTIRHKMSEGFPLLTTKKMAFKSIVVELLWFLKGDTNIKYLVDNNCHIWDGDAYKRYWFNWRPVKEDCGEDLTPYTQEEFIDKIKTDSTFAQVWGELGQVYGKQWRSWKKINEVWDERLHPPFKIEKIELIDQIQNLIDELKTNPDSRRMLVNSWNVGELGQMTLPPCHYSFQVYTRELNGFERWSLCRNEVDVDDPDLYSKLNKINIPKRAISLMWNQRSVDTFLGLPFNIASYGLLLLMLADEVNMVPDELIGNLGDTHLYVDHIDQAREQLTRTPFTLPTVHIRDGIYCSSVEDVILENYQSHSTIKAPLLN